MQRVLIVDDEESIAWALSRLARDEGHEAVATSSAEEALEFLDTKPADLVFLDVRLPGMSGLEAMPEVSRRSGGAKTVVITAFGDLQTAVDAYRHGAFDYLAKPFDTAQAEAVMRRALAAPSRTDAVRSLQPVDGELIGASPAMQELFKRVALVAPTAAGVLISGESGTGKELVARAIHRHSSRSERPFVPIHLAALSATLIESELFGHRRGAFTGADQNRTGLLELANGGTVFLDEISEVPGDVQIKLLRAIEQREIVPVGDTQPRRTDFRIVAASNRDLRQAVRAGHFREDLFFRLAAFELRLPPLRQRGDDITRLALHFLVEFCPLDSELRFSNEALLELQRRQWPGNVRQLRNAVQYAVLLARTGEVDLHHLPVDDDLPPEIAAAPDLSVAVRDWAERRLRGEANTSQLYQEFLDAAQPSLFDVVLERTGQNRAAAAELLGIHRATLRKRLSG